ncbi:MAG: hypothetical protein ACKOYM_00775 [Actinomycetes bacterium]
MNRVQTNQILLGVLAVVTVLATAACTLSDSTTIISLLTTLGII